MAQRQPISSPRRRAAALSLVSSSPGPAEGETERWENGYRFQPNALTGGGVADPCDAEAEFVPPTRPATEEFEPFIVWTGDRCSAFGFTAANYEERAREMLEEQESYFIARELWKGTQAQASSWPNLFLADESSDTLSNGPTAVVSAIACLEQALAECGRGSRGMIHVTPQLAAHLAALGNSLVRREGGMLLTLQDTIVVADAGYDGSGPDGTAAGDSQWAYATGMVTVRRSEPVNIPGSLSEALDRSDNTVAFLAQRLASASWDGQCHFAAEVDLATCLIGGAS